MARNMDEAQLDCAPMEAAAREELMTAYSPSAACGREGRRGEAEGEGRERQRRGRKG